MSLHNKEKFLKEVLSQVKFKYDRHDIGTELEAHIQDKIDYYTDLGYDMDKAEELSVNDMGDAKEIGKELNKQHNPFIGWVWKITNVLLVFSVVISAFVGFLIIASLITENPAKSIDKSNIDYKIDIDEKVKVDDGIIHLTDIILEKNGDLNIIYKYYDTKLWGTGWSHGTMGEISDNLGNRYVSGSGLSSGGIIERHRWTVDNFSKDADTLIITYDYYNRYFKLEIPVKEGVRNE